MLLLLAKLMAAAVVALGVTVVLLFTAFHGKVTPDRLANSVAGEAGHLSMLPCTERRRDDGWSCGVWIDAGEFSSGGVDYAVRVKPDSSCWMATLDADTARRAGVPARMDGCVRVLQLMALLDG